MEAAKTTEMCLLRSMDSLWFYHTILFSKNTLFLNFSSDSPGFSSKSCSQISEQETSPVASVTSGSRDETNSQESDHDDENRPTRLNVASSKTTYHHSSPPLIYARRKFGQIHYSAMRLQKTMSCKSLAELELEEVKGFMDLGFNFKKEELSKHLMKLIPGLQRITNNDEDDENDDKEQKGVMRPYLSEAWGVQRSDSYSPLMNVRVATVSSKEEIKKHMKCWAHTVALSIHQGCC